MPTEATEPEQSDALAIRTGNIKKAYGRYLFWSGILVYGVGAWVQQEVQDALGVWRIIWFTLPLVVATVIIILRAMSPEPLTFWFLVGTIVGTVVFSAIVGLSSGEAVFNAVFHPYHNSVCLVLNTCTTAPLPSNPIDAVYDICKAYLQLYGVVGVIRSIGAGVLIAYGVRQMTRRPSTPVTQPNVTT
jgi:hypothetical protein